MPVLIDYRACDDSPHCGSARACSHGAITYNPSRKKIEVDNSKCTDCAICVRYCPSGAVKFARNEAELKKIEADIASSNLSKDDLLERQYGARPGDPRSTGQNLEHVDCDTFEEEVLRSPVPVAVDFWAEWCAPCRILAPTFKAIAAQYDGRMKFFKLDTEACQDIPYQYGIRSIPTVLFFDRGRVVAREIGAVPKKQLQKTVDQILEVRAS